MAYLNLEKKKIISDTLKRPQTFENNIPFVLTLLTNFKKKCLFFQKCWPSQNTLTLVDKLCIYFSAVYFALFYFLWFDSYIYKIINTSQIGSVPRLNF